MRKSLSAVVMVIGALMLMMSVASAEQPSSPGKSAEAHASAPGQQKQAESPAQPQQEKGNQGNPTPGPPAAKPETPGKPDKPAEHKVTICHRTNSATNPYVQITVDFHAVDGQVVKSKGDHAERHQGPVYEPGMKDTGVRWGDIIPPFDLQGTAFNGMNWTAQGQAIYNADCTVPTPPTVPPTTTPPTTEPPVTTPPTTEPPVTVPPVTTPPATTPPTIGTPSIIVRPPAQVPPTTAAPETVTYELAETGASDSLPVLTLTGIGLLVLGVAMSRKSQRI